MLSFIRNVKRNVFINRLSKNGLTELCFHSILSLHRILLHLAAAAAAAAAVVVVVDFVAVGIIIVIH
jgi:hypothetical protein